MIVLAHVGSQRRALINADYGRACLMREDDKWIEAHRTCRGSYRHVLTEAVPFCEITLEGAFVPHQSLVAVTWLPVLPGEVAVTLNSSLPPALCVEVLP